MKAPTRRALATTLAEAIPVINGQSQNLDYLKAQLDTLTERVTITVPLDLATSTAILRRGFWGRVTWIARGR